MGLLDRLGEAKEAEQNSKNELSDKEELKRDVHGRIVEEYNLSSLALDDGEEGDESEEVLKEKLNDILMEESSKQGVSLGRTEHDRLIRELTNEILGLGPIEPLLNREEVTEVMINGPDKVYAENDEGVVKTDITFRDEDHLLNKIQQIVAPLGRRVDESQPYCDARLPDGSRVNIIIPPLALNGPTVTIRKFAEDPFEVDDLIRVGTLNQQIADFFEACVKASLNVVVSGGTGAGKTTTLNCLSGFIPNDERIITIEDSAELQLQQDHTVRLETRPPNIEGEGEITMRELVKNSLRMRPDRIIVGECRGGEALDMLQAMNTGHDGSLTTLHANTPREAISRLETLVMMAGMDLPQDAIREQIVGAVDLIIQQSRFRDGSRKISSVSEVKGMEQDQVLMNEIFTFDQKGFKNGQVQGKIKATGVRPRFYERIKEQGIELPRDVFTET